MEKGIKNYIYKSIIFYSKISKYLKIILILIFIFILVIPFLFKADISNDNIKDVINIFIGIIGGIVGITFSLFLMYIQNLSNNFSGGVYYIISKRKEALITFILFLLLIFILIILNFNILNIPNQLSLYYSIILLFLSFYFLWDFYNWAINNLPPIKIAEFFYNDSNKKLIKLNKKLSNNINDNNKEIILFYFAGNSEKSLYYLYNSLLGGFIKMLKNNLLFDAKQIIYIFFKMLKDFLNIFKDKFNIHPDFKIILATNSTFTNFFATLLIKINRSCEDTILPSKDYELLNTILYGYRDLILESLKIEYVGNNNFKDENPILTIILGQFNDLGEKIIKQKEVEGAFTWLVISQEIGVKIMLTDKYINFISFLNGLEKFLTNIDIKYDGVLFQEYMKTHICILNEIYQNSEKLYYIFSYFEEILENIKYILLHKAIKNTNGIDIHLDILYKNLFDGIAKLNSQYLNGKLDKGDIYFNKDIRKLLDGFINGLEVYKNNKILIQDYLHLIYFCEFLLNMFENELETGNKNNFYMYYQASQKLSKLIINFESGEENITIFDYQLKIFSLIIKYGLDEYNLYYKDFEELISLYKNYKDKRYGFVRKLYKKLSLILVLLKKESKDYIGLDLLVNEFEISENNKIIENYNGDKDDIKHLLFPIKTYLLRKIDNFNQIQDLHIDSFNNSFSYWFIEKFEITKDDIENFLGTNRI